VGGSIQLGRIWGIPVRIHITFLALVAIIGVEGYLKGGGLAEAGLSMLLIVALFACVTLHELAHSLVARSYGVRVESITLLPLGGIAAMQEMPRQPHEEAVMAIAGPMASVLIATLLGAVIHFTGYTGPVTHYGQPWLTMLMGTNVAIAIFNLIPAFPMDGGRVLRAVLAHYIGLVRATGIAVSLGQGLAVCMALAGIFLFKMNLLLVLIAVFIFFGAGQEGQQVRAQAVLDHITAGQAMVTRFETLNRDAPLTIALGYATEGYQHDFPVVAGDTIVGLVTRQDLLSALHHLGPQHTVGEVMTTQICQVPPEATLTDVYRRIAVGGCGIVLVRYGDRIVGLVSPESIRDQMVAAASGRPRAS